MDSEQLLSLSELAQKYKSCQFVTDNFEQQYYNRK